MVTTVCEIENLEQLRQFVCQVLSEIDQLVPGAFPITERILTRGGRACGIYFCLHGPRAAKFSAIWETEKNTVLFYGPGGERFHRVQLIDHRSQQVAEPTSRTRPKRPATRSPAPAEFATAE